MNVFIGIGRLTKNVEVVEKGNLKIGKFSLAITRSHKNTEGEYEADFLNCIVFNINEYLTNNLLKGTLVSIEGRIQTRSYDLNGERRYSTDIIVDRINILGKKEQTEPIPNVKTQVQQTIEYSEEDLPW